MSLIAGQDRIQRAEEPLYRIIDSETIIVQPDGRGPFVLNGAGTVLWELADGERTIDEMVVALCARYDVAMDVARQDVLRWAESMLAWDLIKLAEREPAS